MTGVIFKLLAVVTAILIISSVAVTLNSVKKLRGRVETQGVIVGIEENTAEVILSEGTNKSVFPVIEYEVNGKAYRFNGSYYSTSMKIGDSVRVLYSAENPEEVSIKTGLYVVPIILWALSIAFLLANLIYYILKMKGFIL